MSPTGPGQAPSRRSLPYVLLALVSYVPLLLTAPGYVGADTKTYLYLDPTRLLSRAASMWDPDVGAGTVTHQTIGYLFPMGPYYWVMQHLGVPDWVAQRLWLGTLLFLAGCGVLFLLRTLGRGTGPGPTVAALAYALSPYTLDYAARISVILLPWAGLGWMIGLTIRALRSGSWRHPALFALVVLAVGGVNATALLYAGVAPVLWFPFAIWVLHEVDVRRALNVAARIGALTLATSLWWIAGLATQGKYGLPILSYTETIDTVARTSLASETLRGLGYWFFYGRDKIGPWIQAATAYTQQVWLILVSFAVPALAFLFAAITRWRHRAYFVTLILVGTVIAVGTYPYHDPSPLGAVFKAAANGSTAGLAMRSTARAVPLVVLGLAVLLGTGVEALTARWKREGWIAAGALAVLVAVNLLPLWQGTMVDANLRRPEDIPAYWHEAATYLDGHDDGTRVMEIPGSDFANYRWGATVDPVLTGIMDRPDLARELIPYGEAASADLLGALDSRMQEGVLDRDAVAPVARLFSVGDLLYRADLQYERYNTPRPRNTWRWLTWPSLAPGLSKPTTFGSPSVTASTPQRYPMQDETARQVPDGAPWPAPVSVFPVASAPKIVRAASTAAPVVVAGDGEGLVDLAQAGLLTGTASTRGPLVYSASLAGQPSELRSLASSSGAHLVVTDSNRKRARRWSTVRENTGYTERAGETPLVKDLKDARLDIFPDAGDEAATVAEQRGVQSVQASDYGNRVSYTPEDRAANAIDGDPTTAWRTSAFGEPVGERWVVQLASPVTTDHLTLLQPVTGPRNRWITKATISFDSGPDVHVNLGDASRTEPGQRVDIGQRTVSKVEIRVDADNVGKQPSYVGYSGVGLAEVGVGDARVDEVIRLPRDLLDTLGSSSAKDRVTVAMTRLRSSVPPRTDEELSLKRSFALPTSRPFSVSGTARISWLIPDELIDQLLGTPLHGVVARSSGRLPGNIRARASAALDGDPSTSWQTAFGPADGSWIETQLPAPATVSSLALQVVADGHHSVPTKLRIEGDGGQVRTVTLPAVKDATREGATAKVPVSFRAMTTSRLRVTVEATRKVTQLDFFSEEPIAFPIGIAELGVPGVHVAAPTGSIDTGCRTDLLTVDGTAVPLRITGSVRDAAELRGLSVRSCDGSPLVLRAGDHEVRTAEGRRTGLDLDQLALDSAAPKVAPKATRPPNVVVRNTSSTSMDVTVTGAKKGTPFWLVVGESFNKGWKASVKGDGATLGADRLVEGYANGWLVRPSASGTLHIDVDWTPQKTVRLAIWFSVIGTLGCIALAIRPPRVRTRRPAPTDPAPIYAPPDLRGGETSVRAIAMATAAAAAGFVLVAGPVVGVLGAIAVALALRWPRLRAWMLGAAVASVAVAGVITAVGQARHHYPPEFEWPTFFTAAHTLGWLAIVLLAGDALVGLVRRPRGMT